MKIKSIKPLGIKPVYDIINVQKNNNYIGNDFILHNSEWAKKEHKELKKKLAQVRTKHLLYILCFPLKIAKLEKTYLESFVNYWCLTGDTKVLIKDKNSIKQINMKDLVTKKDKYKVASFNINTNKIEYKENDGCVLTKKNADVYEIELENGQKIKATKEHKFLTKNRGYVELQDLRTWHLLVCRKTIMNFLKIKTIRMLEKKEDVFDILEVEDNNNFIANNMIVHNCDLFERGRGALYVKDKNPMQDSWRIKDFKNIGSYTEFTSVAQVEKKLKKHPNFWQIIKFPKPPRWLYDRYLTVREKNVYDEQNILQNVSKEDIHNALLILSLRDIMMHDATLSVNRVLLHVMNEYGVRLSKSAIQYAINDARQLVEKVRDKSIEV